MSCVSRVCSFDFVSKNFLTKSNSILAGIRSLLLILLVHKIAFIANESITPLKLIDLGFSKEQLALTALLDFPSQIVLSVLAAKWSMGPRPLQPWLKAQYIRAFMALVGMGTSLFV
jgi:hypothetical protein